MNVEEDDVFEDGEEITICALFRYRRPNQYMIIVEKHRSVCYTIVSCLIFLLCTVMLLLEMRELSKMYDSSLRGLTVFAVGQTMLYLFPITLGLCKGKYLTIENHRRFRRVEIFHNSISLILCIYAIRLLQMTSNHPMFNCYNHSCNSLRNMLELFVMIRLFPLVMICLQYSAAIVYITCCLCRLHRSRVRRSQRLPQVNAFLDEHVVAFADLDPQLHEANCAICLD